MAKETARQRKAGMVADRKLAREIMAAVLPNKSAASRALYRSAGPYHEYISLNVAIRALEIALKSQDGEVAGAILDGEA